MDPSKVKAGDTVTVSVLDPDIQPEPYTVSGRVYAPGNGFLAVGMTTLRHNGEWDGRATLTAHQPAPEPEPDLLAETIWKASRADEGTISATGANHVAAAIRNLFAVIDPAKVDVDGLKRALASADYDYQAQADAALKFLGIEE